MEPRTDSSRHPTKPGPWLTAGLACGLALAGLRALCIHGARLRDLPDAEPTVRAILRWEAWGALLAALPWALPAGCVVLWLCSRTASRRSGLLVSTIAALALLPVLAGVGGPPALRAGLYLDLHADDLALQLPLSLLSLAACAEFIRHVAVSGLARAMTAGVLALVAWQITVGVQAPRFERHQSVLDILARPQLRTVLVQNPGQGPAVDVLTPAVHMHADCADKPSLWMPPPCAVQVDLPAGMNAGLLRAAAGMDRRVRSHLPQGVERAVVDYSIEVNGHEVWRVRIANDRARAGVWTSPEWIWKHAGGATGLNVRGGDRLVFRTSIPEGEGCAGVAPEHMRVGFGTMVIDAVEELPRTRARPETPNLVLVVMDTLRADRMSCYGYEKLTTPHLDRLALRGVLFEEAYATSSWTWPSTASILTGLAADAHGVVSNEACTLALALTSVAEQLQLRGYTTAAFSCNPLIAPQRYFDQGFETFDYKQAEFRMSDEVMPDVLRWLDGHAGARFFLYLHLADPHTPHRPHPEELVRLGGEQPADFHEGGLDAFSSELLGEARRTGKAPAVRPQDQAWVDDVYDASVATGDRWLGLLLSRMAALGLEDKTLVLFTADHGEELLERGRIGHGHGVHAELVRVPLILAGPGVPAGVRSTRLVSNRYAAPTLAMWAGTELPGMGDGELLSDSFDGRDGGAVLFQTRKGDWGSARQQELVGLRSERWVLHWRPEDGDGQVRLYDLEVDASERQDVSAQHPEQAQALRAEAARRLHDQKAWAPEHRVGVGAGGLETLYGIGYADRDPDGEQAEDDR